MAGFNLKRLLPSAREIKKITGGRIEHAPPFPRAATELLKTIQRGDNAAEAVGRIINAEPDLAAKLLRFVSSDAYGSIGKISSISNAVVLLGAPDIRSIALEIDLFERIVKPAGRKNFNAPCFWKHSLAVAGLCRGLAEQTGIAEPDALFAAGLLHDIGKVVLEAEGDIVYGRLVNSLSAHEGPLVDLEREIIGVGHDELGAFYFNRWNLPEPMVLTALFHHRRFAHLELPPQVFSMIAAVSFADFIAWSHGTGSVDIARQPLMHPDVEPFISIGALDLEPLMMQMDREVNRFAGPCGFSPSNPDQYRPNLLRTSIALGRHNTRCTFAPNGKVGPLARISKSITRPHRSLDPKEIISGTLEAIHLDFGFDRLYVLQTDPDSRSLKAAGAYAANAAERAELMRLEVRPDDAESGFIECMRNHMPLLLTGNGRAENRFLKDLGSRESAIVPISCNDRVIGILGADNALSGRPVNAADLTAVALIANEMGTALQNARTIEELRNRASYDGLTGVYNRTTIVQLMEENFQLAQKGPSRLSVAMIDVDFFKTFNDRYGHLAGDSVLKLIAASLSKFSRPTEVVGRYGGEEFISILKNTDLTGAIRYGERIRQKIQELGRLLINRFPDHELTVSVGTAAYQKGISVKEQLIDLADKAMYASKIGGRNRVMTARLGPEGEAWVAPAAV